MCANCNNKVRTGRSKFSESTISKRRSDDGVYIAIETSCVVCVDGYLELIFGSCFFWQLVELWYCWSEICLEESFYLRFSLYCFSFLEQN